MPHDPWAHPAARVRAAIAAREGALAAWRHSPNADTERIYMAITRTLDYRLEQLWASMTDAQRAQVEARPVRKRDAQTYRPTLAPS
jgi:hypothetical protein